MKTEEMNKRRQKMIVLDIRLDNFYAFKNFHMNLTYPKKIVDSSIENEHLPGRPRFRYKKVNIFLGANATGKTTFGKILMKIFNFVEKKNFEIITNAIHDTSKKASFALDLASENNDFYRLKCEISPCTEGKYNINDIKVQILTEKIGVRDSYNSCVKRIANTAFTPAENYIEELEKIGELAWLFDYPDVDGIKVDLPNKDVQFCIILENVLKSLDPSIESVRMLKDVEKSYVLTIHNQPFVLQSNVEIKTDVLSSGTKSGIAIARIIYSLMKGLNSFYYCDEKFSYIQSDVEKAILSVMIDFVGPYDQLFFTTHNTDILDMNLPKHAFTFLRKNIANKDCPITCIEASSLLKRNTDSLRNAVENDLFSTAPAVEMIYSLADLVSEE